MNNARFNDSIEAVYGLKNEIILERIEVDLNQSNYFNLKDYIEEEPEDSIKARETDLKLNALKKAIDAYNSNKNKDNLEQVKIEWLKKPKGNVSLPKKADSTNSISDNPVGKKIISNLIAT